MDPVQILLFIVVTSLTGLLVAVGIQAFLILKDAHSAVQKFNGLLDDARVLTGSVARPIEGLRSFVEGASGIKSALELVTGLTKPPEIHKNQKLQEPLALTLEQTPYTPEPQIYNFETNHLLASNDEPEQEMSTAHSFQSPARRVFHRNGKPLSS